MQTLIQEMIKNLEKQIRFFMNDWGYTYEQAKAKAMESSTAGNKVWEVLDRKFAPIKTDTFVSSMDAERIEDLKREDREDALQAKHEMEEKYDENY